MAVREFVDEQGKRWRTWSVTPASLHPAVKAEDYLAEIYQTGWLVFETMAGDEKRRLSLFPRRWADASDDELRAMLNRAEPVPARKLDMQRAIPGDLASTLHADAAADLPVDVSDLQVSRTFRYPGGRYWTVSVVQHPEEGGPPVLRFTSGTRNIDLRRWSKDWANYPDERLVELLRHAAPRLERGPLGPGIPRRRWDDPPAEA